MFRQVSSKSLKEINQLNRVTHDRRQGGATIDGVFLKETPKGWVFVRGSSAATGEVMDLGSHGRNFDSKEEALEAAKKLGLKVDNAGKVGQQQDAAKNIRVENILTGKTHIMSRAKFNATFGVSEGKEILQGYDPDVLAFETTEPEDKNDSGQKW